MTEAVGKRRVQRARRVAGVRAGQSARERHTQPPLVVEPQTAEREEGQYTLSV